MWILLNLLLLSIWIGWSLPRWRQHAAIKRWYNALNLKTHEANHLELYQAIDGFLLSKEARSQQDAIEYTYGEIEFTSFIALLSLTKPDSSTIFYDLGSGTGKAVLACAMVFSVHKSCGIELLGLLNNTALNQQQKLAQLPGYFKQSSALHFTHANFLECNFSEATHLFINATAFFGDSWILVQQALKQLKAGTIIITTSKKLKSDEFIVIKKTKVGMSWGPVAAYIHQRV